MATTTAPKPVILAVIWACCLHSAAAAPQWPQPQRLRLQLQPGYGYEGYTGYTHPLQVPFRHRLPLAGLAPARAPVVAKTIYVVVDDDGSTGDQQLFQALPSLLDLLGGHGHGQGAASARPGAQAPPPPVPAPGPPGGSHYGNYGGAVSPGRQPSKTPAFVDDEDPPIPPPTEDDEEYSAPDTSPSSGSGSSHPAGDHGGHTPGPTEDDYDDDNPPIDIRSGQAGTRRVKPAALTPQSKISDSPVFA